MLIRVTRKDWTAVFTVDDSRMEEVIELANRHFGSQDLQDDRGSPPLPPRAQGRNQGRNMVRKVQTRYKP